MKYWSSFKFVLSTQDLQRESRISFALLDFESSPLRCYFACSPELLFLSGSTCFVGDNSRCCVDCLGIAKEFGKRWS